MHMTIVGIKLPIAARWHRRGSAALAATGIRAGLADQMPTGIQELTTARDPLQRV